MLNELVGCVARSMVLKMREQDACWGMSRTRFLLTTSSTEPFYVGLLPAHTIALIISLSYCLATWLALKNLFWLFKRKKERHNCSKHRVQSEQFRTTNKTMTDLSALLESSRALTANLTRRDLPSVNLSLDQIEAQSRRLVSRQAGSSSDNDRAYVPVSVQVDSTY